MKKIISLILVLMFVFSLAAMVGCSKKDETPADTTPADTTEPADTTTPADTTPADGEITQEMLDASKPNEYVPEKIAAGMTVTFAFNPASFDGIGAPQDVLLKEWAENLGMTYVCTSWEQNTATQIQQIENWMTMGVAAVAVHTSDAESIADITAQAEEAGTSIIFYGTYPTYFCSGFAGVNLDALGYSSGLMARAWVEQTYPDAAPGSIKTAVFGFYIVTDVGVLTEGLKRGIGDIEAVEIVYTHDDCTGIDKGYTATQEAFTAEPDIKLIGSYDLYAAFGANNYIMSMPGVNPEEYCIVGTTSNSDVNQFIEDSKTNASVLRGTCTGSDDPAWAIKVAAEAVLFEGAEKPFAYFEELNCVTSIDFDYAAYFDQYYVPAE